MESIEIRTEDLQDVTVVCVRGEIDLATAPMLQNALRSAIQSGRHVVVDLANATYVDLRGFRTLIEAKDTLGERQALAVAASSPLVHKVIEIIELATVLPVFHSRQEALNFVRSHH
jgi:anti-sigma B factor antagonist